ncbi:beta-galactosidase, putative [Talaromyces stipitatus ATCC 10500]|uniref:Beta-galactosidase n=1 Tax=Talaromyces stipitatus (strain ATCC 10500 / CBS 375.48 / QM 6759 / NRRL 1006) TaxID=441959 RepID=B8M3B6_TALSN|nr:beta-galactosidase, putative [Talaromyces stipitatus ATCC 10500]EED22288.1 beta-galactosidase, putative [Talaromyces stipitatus ATCC 10500]
MKFLLGTTVAALACLSGQALGRAVSHRSKPLTVLGHPDIERRALLQDIVTWDNQSLYIHGEKLMIFSGEVHPFRLPVASLYIDIFHKIKALGFNTVSFYVDWALLEGKPGTYRAEGIFDLQPFFDAAKQAGIYLLARPGPYINAEVSGGGFPGWLQRVNGTLRTRDPAYFDSTKNYANHIAGTIAKNQITKGGPIILYQPENEYSGWATGYSDDPQYMQDIEDTARNAGVIVPFISNDAGAYGHNAPGSGVGAVDIYGHDSYPLGFDCANPSTWPAGDLPTYFRQTHVQQSPSTPFSLVEFQGGSFDPWQGPGFAKCTALLGPEFERVFYKNNIAAGAVFLNLYMTFGGTNWGNLGYPDGYTSYDYGSAISESRNITREKYSQLKLIGNFLKVSPSYLDAVPGSASNSTYSSTSALTVTPLIGRSTKSSFFVVRHSDYSSLASTSYTLKVPTSAGVLTLPQLSGSLSLNGRDSKIHVTDYNVAGTNILYSTAEVFTWKNFSDYKALVLYGGPGEHHELAISSSSNAQISVVDGSKSGVTTKIQNGQAIIAWDVSSSRRVVKVDDLLVFLLDRNSAYSYWVPQVSTSNSSVEFSSQETVANSIIVNAGYLVRYAYLQGNELHLSADFNATTNVEVIGAPPSATRLFVNGVQYDHAKTSNGFWTASVKYNAPKISLPDFSKLTWKYVDSLPEIQATYDDSAWISANHDWTNNTANPLKTPVSLYASDYGFNTGHLLYRGHFVANGNEKYFNVQTIGGSGFGSSVWLNDKLLGSWTGSANNDSAASSYTLSALKAGSSYNLTILVANTGLEEDWTVGTETMKTPRGILNFDLSGHSQSDVTWKLTGNLGGEDYVDLARGPLNEGGLYAERQGWHQPSPPSSDWKTSSPLEGISQARVGFYSTSFTLDLPEGYDIPLYFAFGDSSGSLYRAQLYVNGYQYGTYVPQLGPQTEFPVPQGILNYQGENWVAITLWAQESSGAKVDSFELINTTPVLTALTGIESSPQPAYSQRKGAY